MRIKSWPHLEVLWWSVNGQGPSFVLACHALKQVTNSSWPEIMTWQYYNTFLFMNAWINQFAHFLRLICQSKLCSIYLNSDLVLANAIDNHLRLCTGKSLTLNAYLLISSYQILVWFIFVYQKSWKFCIL